MTTVWHLTVSDPEEYERRGGAAEHRHQYYSEEEASAAHKAAQEAGFNARLDVVKSLKEKAASADECSDWCPVAEDFYRIADSSGGGGGAGGSGSGGGAGAGGGAAGAGGGGDGGAAASSGGDSGGSGDAAPSGGTSESGEGAGGPVETFGPDTDGGPEQGTMTCGRCGDRAYSAANGTYWNCARCGWHWWGTPRPRKPRRKKRDEEEELRTAAAWPSNAEDLLEDCPVCGRKGNDTRGADINQRVNFHADDGGFDGAAHAHAYCNTHGTDWSRDCDTCKESIETNTDYAEDHGPGRECRDCKGPDDLEELEKSFRESSVKTGMPSIGDIADPDDDWAPQEGDLHGRVKDKLHPGRFKGMSPQMAAIVGHIMGEKYTEPHITELNVTSDGFLTGSRSNEEPGKLFIGTASELDDNWNRLTEVADLDDDEFNHARKLYRQALYPNDWRDKGGAWERSSAAKIADHPYADDEPACAEDGKEAVAKFLNKPVCDEHLRYELADVPGKLEKIELGIKNSKGADRLKYENLAQQLKTDAKAGQERINQLELQKELEEAKVSAVKREDKGAEEGHAVYKTVQAPDEEEATRKALEQAAKSGFDGATVKGVENSHKDFWNVFMRAPKKAATITGEDMFNCERCGGQATHEAVASTGARGLLCSGHAESFKVASQAAGLGMTLFPLNKEAFDATTCPSCGHYASNHEGDSCSGSLYARCAAEHVAQVLETPGDDEIPAWLEGFGPEDQQPIEQDGDLCPSCGSANLDELTGECLDCGASLDDPGIDDSELGLFGEELDEEVPEGLEEEPLPEEPEEEGDYEERPEDEDDDEESRRLAKVARGNDLVQGHDPTETDGDYDHRCLECGAKDYEHANWRGWDAIVDDPDPEDDVEYARSVIDSRTAAVRCDGCDGTGICECGGSGRGCRLCDNTGTCTACGGSGAADSPDADYTFLRDRTAATEDDIVAHLYETDYEAWEQEYGQDRADEAEYQRKNAGAADQEEEDDDIKLHRLDHGAGELGDTEHSEVHQQEHTGAVYDQDDEGEPLDRGPYSSDRSSLDDDLDDDCKHCFGRGCDNCHGTGKTTERTQEERAQDIHGLPLTDTTRAFLPEWDAPLTTQSSLDHYGFTLKAGPATCDHCGKGGRNNYQEDSDPIYAKFLPDGRMMDLHDSCTKDIYRSNYADETRAASKEAHEGKGRNKFHVEKDKYQGDYTDQKMEDCVQKLKAQGHDESSAIAICKDSGAGTKDKESHPVESKVAQQSRDPQKAKELAEELTHPGTIRGHESLDPEGTEKSLSVGGFDAQIVNEPDDSPKERAKNELKRAAGTDVPEHLKELFEEEESIEKEAQATLKGSGCGHCGSPEHSSEGHAGGGHSATPASTERHLDYSDFQPKEGAMDEELLKQARLLSDEELMADPFEKGAAQNPATGPVGTSVSDLTDDVGDGIHPTPVKLITDHRGEVAEGREPGQCRFCREPMQDHAQWNPTSQAGRPDKLGQRRDDDFSAEYRSGWDSDEDTRNPYDEALINAIENRCPGCGKDWNNVFGDGNPYCTDCIRDGKSSRENFPVRGQ